jgi:hypothetical protein
MTITPKQVANLIFATSQLRWFEKEYAIDPTIECKDIVVKWQYMVDKVLSEMGVEEFVSREQLIEIITLEYNANTSTKKENEGIQNAR